MIPNDLLLRIQVFSWDEDAGTYDKNYEDGRSYISVISEIVTDEDEECDGKAKKTMGEARMDIVNSEIGYLGHYDSESYGLTWKVSDSTIQAMLQPYLMPSPLLIRPKDLDVMSSRLLSLVMGDFIR